MRVKGNGYCISESSIPNVIYKAYLKDPMSTLLFGGFGVVYLDQVKSGIEDSNSQ